MEHPFSSDNNKIIKCLKHCVRFELTIEDTTNKLFPKEAPTPTRDERGREERDEKKKNNFFFDFFTKRRRSFLLL
jgi:hypothetical protein